MKAFDEEFFEDIKGLTENPNSYRGSGSKPIETLTDLENDQAYQADAEKYLAYLAKNTNGWRKFLDAGSWDSNEDIFETLRDEDYRLGTITTRAGQLEEAPEDVKQAYARLRTRFNDADIGEGNRLKAFYDIGTDIIADPINIVSVLFGVKGVGANASAKQGVAQTLKRIAAENSKDMATVRGAVGASAWMGVDNYYRQNAELAVGLRNQFDTMELGTYSLGAGLVGGSLGRYFGVTKPSATRQRTLDKAVDEEGIGDQIDADVTVEVMNDSFSFASNALPRGGATIEGEFEEIFEVQAASLAKKYGGGERTKGELYDAVRAAIKENQGASGEKIRSAIRQKVRRTLHGLSPTRAFIEKPASILDSYIKFSKTAALLQKKFRYDLGRSWRGERKIEASDFFETFSHIRGERLVRIKEALEPFNLHLKGDALDEAKKNVIRALRGDTDQSKEITKAASEIRKVLDEIGDDLVGYGIMDKPVKDYVPRMWDRKAILNNQDAFADALIKNEVTFTPKGAKKEVKIDRNNVDTFITEMLDIENRVDLGAKSSFFSSRTLNIADDLPFEGFLDNNLDSLLNSYTAQTSKSIAKTKVFGVRDIRGFKELWVDQIGKEMKEAGQKAFTPREQEAILDVYRTATGEGVNRYGDGLQTGLDWYVVGTRLALLPLATVSSLTEIAINISKAGLKNSTKGFAKAFKTALTSVTDDTVEDLMTKGLSRSEAFKEMNKVSIAMDQALADGAERLSGEALSSDWQRKVNNTFFRVNLLDQWTKFVQLTSFTTAKELISDNLSKIAGAIDSPTARTKIQIGELTELGLDVDKALDWYRAGAKRSDDFYQNDILKAAGRYTNEVILNPSPEAGIKPNLMSNPKTSILFQLMGYPAAFTNVILKKFITDTVKDPVGNLPKIASTAIIMTGMAAATNHIRSHGKNRKDKTEEEVLMEAIARWGGNGLLLDQYQRAKKASKYYQSSGAFVTGLGGPIVGDVYRAIRLDAWPAQIAGKKFIPYAAMNPILGQETKKEYDDILRAVDNKIKDLIVPERDKPWEIKSRYTDGGIVEFFKVPNAPEVPRERIDKMTGRPYEEQAEDPLERLGLVGGGIIKGLAKIIKDLSVTNLDEFSSYKAAQEIREKAGLFNDTPTPEDDLLADRVRAVMEGRSFMEPEDLDVDVENVLDAFGARELPVESFVKSRSLYNFSESVRKDRKTSPLIEKDKLQKAIEVLRTSKDKDMEETNKYFNRLLLRMPRTARPVIDDAEEVVSPSPISVRQTQTETRFWKSVEDDPPNAEELLNDFVTGATIKDGIFSMPPTRKNIKGLTDWLDDMKLRSRGEAERMPPRMVDSPWSGRPYVEQFGDGDALAVNRIKEFIKNSKIKVPVYRATSDGLETDFEMNFAFPREMGAHFGTLAQAEDILKARVPHIFDDAPFSYRNKAGVEPEPWFTVKELDEVLEAFTPELKQGYLNIENPLVLDVDYGSWDAINILLSPPDLKSTVKRIAEQSKTPVNVVERELVALSHLGLQAYRNILGKESLSDDVHDLVKHVHKAHMNTLFKKYLQSRGFDSVMYKNTAEGSKMDYSFIAFEPQQFKMSTALKFDKDDPRAFRYGGGRILNSLLTKPAVTAVQGKYGGGRILNSLLALGNT